MCVRYAKFCHALQLCSAGVSGITRAANHFSIFRCLCVSLAGYSSENGFNFRCLANSFCCASFFCQACRSAVDEAHNNIRTEFRHIAHTFPFGMQLIVDRTEQQKPLYVRTVAVSRLLRLPNKLFLCVRFQISHIFCRGWFCIEQTIGVCTINTSRQRTKCTAVCSSHCLHRFEYIQQLDPWKGGAGGSNRMIVLYMAPVT